MRELDRYLPDTSHLEAVPFSAENAQFPLTDLQAAYIVGRSQLIELGGRQQYYMELDAVGLDPQRAEEALNRLVLRYEHLRTVMLEEGDQRVLDPLQTPRVQLTVIDLTDLPPRRREAALAETRTRMCEEGLDPTGWPLFDVVVSRLRRRRARVHLRYSLILLDGPSLDRLINEWGELYHDLDAPLPPVERTFRHWRLDLLDFERSGAYREQWAYWEARLDSLPEAPRLPLVKQPKSIDSVTFHGRTSYLTKEQWKQFCANFRRHRVLPATALMHVLAETLGQWAANPHFCLNVVHFGTAARHGGPDVVGQRSSTLPLEIDLRADDDFWKRAHLLQRRFWKDMANSDVSGVRITRELAARNGWSQRAVFPYVFTSNQGAGWDVPLPISRPAFRPVLRVQHTPQVLIDNQIRDLADGGIASNLDFVDEAFPPGLPDLIAATYDRLLTRLTQPGAADAEPELMSPEHVSLIEGINESADPVSADRLEDGFLRRAEAAPDALAILSPAGSLTYRELEARSRMVAQWLNARDIGPGDIVPVVMAKGWEQVVAVLGTLRAGAAYCPIPSGTPAQALDGLLKECEARVVLTQSHEPADSMQPLWRLEVDLAKGPSGEGPDVVTSPTDLAYVIYTSGSTGRPKGVMIDHRGSVNTIQDVNERVGLGPGDRVFGVSSLAFDLSVWDIFGTLAAGGALVLPRTTQPPDPVGWATTAHDHGVTVWNSVPALAEMMVETVEQRPDTASPPIRAFLLSGDRIATSLPKRIRELWPEVTVLPMGGATEASIWSNVYEGGEVDSSWDSMPYGRPLRNQTMKVLDHQLRVRQPWATGRIFIGGIGLAHGYWRDQARTAERFLRHPDTGERLYWTGDLGRYRPDGTIEFLGREDRQVKILGYRVEPGAVEIAIRAHPRVRECVVYAENAPDGQRRLAALVVPEPDSDLDDHSLTTHLRSHLAHYMIPGQIHLIDHLPLTPNGKVDISRALASLQGNDTNPARGRHAASPIENRLCELWAELLEVPAVTPDSNFFALGGSSLLALRMVNRVHTAFGVDLPLGRVFETPTVREFAEHLNEGEREATCGVQLTDGDGEELFLFHVMGGSVAPYIPLAEAWPGPVRAFQSVSHIEPTAPFAPDLETMAATYCTELVRDRPEGPYILGGWSMGGFLAYEVARQLEANGREAQVFMIDSRVEDFDLPANETERHLSFLLALTLGPPPLTAVQALRAADPSELSRVARDTFVAHGLLPAEIDVPGYERLVRILEHEMAVTAAWRPGPLNQPALFFVATQERDRRDPVSFWRAMCPRIEFQNIPADHFSIGGQLPEIARRAAAWIASMGQAVG